METRHEGNSCELLEGLNLAREIKRHIIAAYARDVEILHDCTKVSLISTQLYFLSVGL